MTAKRKTRSLTVQGGGYLHRALMQTEHKVKSAVKRALKKAARETFGGRKRR